MYAIRLTSEELNEFVEKIPGDRRIEAYAIEPVTFQSDDEVIPTIIHSLIISGEKPQG